MTIAYKLVLPSPDDKRLRSFAVHAKGWVRSYSTTRWTKAVPGSCGLFVFDTLENAQACLLYGTELWECECKGPLPYPVVRLRDPGLFPALVYKLFWKLHNAGQPPPEQTSWFPAGTICFEQVKLTKLIAKGCRLYE